MESNTKFKNDPIYQDEIAPAQERLSSAKKNDGTIKLSDTISQNNNQNQIDHQQIHVQKNGEVTEEESEDQLLYEHEMESNEIDYEEVKVSECFGIKKYKDSIYKGELDERKREGRGVIVYDNGRLYEGTWVKDKRNGRGYERFANSNVYQGEYTDGKAHGKGVFTWENGEVYDGEWSNGVKQGYGVWNGIDGDSYIGQWKNSKAEGFGVHKWKNGDRYEGEWKACLRHGSGSDFFSNDDHYVGQYQYGNPNGFGKYVWQNGNTYAGEFKHGQKHGKGKWKKKVEPGQISNCYEGQYLNDKKNGYGEFQWASGNMFKGYYVDDVRQDYGEMYWVDGSIYRGQWHDGIQHGLGLMIFEDGTRKAGYFDQNVFKVNLETIQEINEYDDPIPEQFKQELKEYLGFVDPEEDPNQYIDVEFKAAEKEDPPQETAFKYMQEIVNVHLNGMKDMNKSLYAAQVQKKDDFENSQQQYRNMVNTSDLNSYKLDDNLMRRTVKHPNHTIDYYKTKAQDLFKSNRLPLIQPIISSKNGGGKQDRFYQTKRDTLDSSNAAKGLWHAVQGNTNSTINLDRIKYNDFQYVKRISSLDNGDFTQFNNNQPSVSQLNRKTLNQSQVYTDNITRDQREYASKISNYDNSIRLDDIKELSVNGANGQLQQANTTKYRNSSQNVQPAADKKPLSINIYLNQMKMPQIKKNTHHSTGGGSVLGLRSQATKRSPKNSNNRNISLQPLAYKNKLWIPSGKINNVQNVKSSSGPPGRLFYQAISPLSQLILILLLSQHIKSLFYCINIL